VSILQPGLQICLAQGGLYLHFPYILRLNKQHRRLLQLLLQVHFILLTKSGLACSLFFLSLTFVASGQELHWLDPFSVEALSIIGCYGISLLICSWVLSLH